MAIKTGSFPKELDGAKVLYHTDRGAFDPVYYSGGAIAHHVFYLAVCKYSDDEDYYVFHCDENLEVVADDALPTMKACQRYMDAFDVTWYKQV